MFQFSQSPRSNPITLPPGPDLQQIAWSSSTTLPRPVKSLPAYARLSRSLSCSCGEYSKQGVMPPLGMIPNCSSHLIPALIGYLSPALRSDPKDAHRAGICRLGGLSDTIPVYPRRGCLDIDGNPICAIRLARSGPEFLASRTVGFARTSRCFGVFPTFCSKPLRLARFRSD